MGAEIVGFVRVGNGTEHLTGVPHGDKVGGNVFGHDAPGTDDGIVPDGNVRQNLHVAAQPYVLADADGCAPAAAVISESSGSLKIRLHL